MMLQQLLLQQQRQPECRILVWSVCKAPCFLPNISELSVHALAAVLLLRSPLCVVFQDAGSAEVFKKVDHRYAAAAAAKSAGVPYFGLVSAQGAAVKTILPKQYLQELCARALAAVLLLRIFLLFAAGCRQCGVQKSTLLDFFEDADGGMAAAASKWTARLHPDCCCTAAYRTPAVQRCSRRLITTTLQQQLQRQRRPECHISA
jgi:hypothetical protein